MSIVEGRTDTLHVVAMTTRRETIARVRELLFGHGNSLFCGSVSSVAEAQALLTSGAADLVLVDVDEYPESIEALGRLGALATKVKPVDAAAFESSGRDPIETHRDPVEPLIARTRGPGQAVRQVLLDRLLVRSRGSLRVVPVREIRWIDAMHNQVILHTASDQLRAYYSISAIAGAVDPSVLIRIHRSTLVNVGQIRELKLSARGQYSVLLESGPSLSVGRTYKDSLLAVLHSSAGTPSL